MGGKDKHGQRYTIVFVLEGPNGEIAQVKSGLSVRTDEDFPRLTTCFYPGGNHDRDNQLYDVVALLEAVPEHNLVRGSVGTIVDVYPDGDYEVEFANNDGEAYTILSVSPHQLMLLHHELKSRAA